MIPGTLALTPAFAEPELVWRELQFRVSDVESMSTDEDPLGPIEVQLPPELHSAVAKRRSEFLAGRLCAAMALRALGQPVDLPRKGRAPHWPEGLRGSITHNHHRAIAVVSARHDRLGIDCEAIMPAEQAQRLQAEILSSDEAALRPEGMGLGAFVTLVFSAKEALYKALSHKLDRVPGFLEARVIGIASDRLHIAFDGAAHVVRHRFIGDECLTLVAEPS